MAFIHAILTSMGVVRERILLVENNPEVCDLVARQTLEPLGYKVEVVTTAASAIQESVRFLPDVIIADLKLPGLSGKDLLVALSSQGLDMPIIVIAQKGMEADVIQAFRLGAADYLLWPIREAEVVSAVERVLKQVRSRLERETLARQLKQTNQELHRRVRELTTIFAVGKAVTSITDQRLLFEKIVEGAVYITEADCGWLLLREERTKTFILSACRNVPQSILEKLNQPWEDGISSLVALSGESLSVHGEPIKRFKVARLGQSVLVVPVKIKREVVGLLVVIRQAATPFGASNQALLEAVADYASISLVNARLFKTLEDRVRSLQSFVESTRINERIKADFLRQLSHEISLRLKSVWGQLDALVNSPGTEQGYGQTSVILQANQELKYLKEFIESISIWYSKEFSAQVGEVDLNEAARQAISRFQRPAQYAGVTLYAELPASSIKTRASSSHIIVALEGLISNAIKYNKDGGQVTVHLAHIVQDGVGWADASVRDDGIGIIGDEIPRIFDLPKSKETNGIPHLAVPGITLPMIKEIVLFYGGQVWVESEPAKGSVFHLALPLFIP